MEISPLRPEHITPWSHLLAVCFNRQAEDMVHLLAFLQPADRLIAWGVWDGPVLAAQYSCWLTAVHNPGGPAPLPVGMSVNMAVHPAYRGRGLVKWAAEPVYAALRQHGAVAGVGFSNTQGVQVDRRSKGYGYGVVGQLRPSLFYVRQGQAETVLTLESQWPCRPFTPFTPPQRHCFHVTPEGLQHRFARHPFRHYHFGVWLQPQGVAGLIVYRQVRLGPFPAVALLAIYGHNMAELIGRWLRAIWRQGVRLVHVLTTPDAGVLHALRQAAAVSVPLPLTRTPYYLTLKPLSPAMPASLGHFPAWECIGGDIL